jgi:MFS transporter, FSR family, fosmidomycin resistance protein
MLTLFRNRLFFAVASGHFVVDVLNSIVPVLLAVLATSFSLTNAQIGLALTLFTFCGSLSQPVFGWLADRFRGRPALLAGAGTAWMAAWFLGIALAQTWWQLLACLLIGVLGSGLFHPVGASASAAAHPARAGSATALFFFCGQIGLALGPLIAGLLFRSGGVLGVLPLSIVALLPAGLLLTAPAAPRAIVTPRAGHTAVHAAFVATTAFILLVAVRSSIQATYSAFLPKLFADRGWDPVAYGALAGTFMLTAAVGNVVTGELADRQGMRAATVWPLLLSVPAGLICLWAPTPATAFVACALAGILIGGQHSVLVLHAQRLLPTGQGFAAGLILGFTFAAGGIGVWVGGLIADRVGLMLVMQAITLLGIPAALLALTLPGRPSLPQATAVEPVMR